MKGVVFTDEAIRTIEDKILESREELKIKATKEASKRSGESIEVTKADVLSVYNKSRNNNMSSRVTGITKIYLIIGIFLIFIGITYPYIKGFMENADEDTIKGIGISLIGISMMLMSYLLKVLFEYKYKKRTEYMRIYERVNIQSDIKDIEVSKSLNMEDEEKHYSNIKYNNDIDDIIRINPRISIIESFGNIEREINKILYRDYNVDIKTGYNLRKYLETLYKNNYIDIETLNMLDKMRMLRNKIAHSSEELDVSYEEAREYRLLSLQIINKLMNLNPLKKVYIICGSKDSVYKDLIDSWNSDKEKFIDIISIDKDSETYQSLINSTIKTSDVILLILNKDSFKSKFVKYEIEIAKKYNKKIIVFNMSGEDIELDINNYTNIDDITKKNLIDCIYRIDIEKPHLE